MVEKKRKDKIDIDNIYLEYNKIELINENTIDIYNFTNKSEINVYFIVSILFLSVIDNNTKNVKIKNNINSNTQISEIRKIIKDSFNSFNDNCELYLNNIELQDNFVLDSYLKVKIN